MPFDSDGKWTPPGGKWAYQQHQEDVQQAEQMSPDEIARRQAGNQMDTEPLPTPPDDGSDNNPSNLPEGVSSEFAANHPDLTNFLNSATSPIRNFLNNTSIGQGIKRFGQGADQIMFPGAVGSPAATTGNEYVDKAIDFASMIPGTLINPGGAATGLGTAMEKGSDLAELGFNALTKGIQPTSRIGDIAMDLGRGFTKDAVAGVPFAVNDQFNNQSDESMGDRLKDIGLESLGFGAFGLGLRGAGKAIEATGLPSKITDFLGRNRNEETPLEEPKTTEDTPLQEQITQPISDETGKPTEEPFTQAENNVASPALSPKEQEFLDLLGKNGRSLDDVESALQKANDDHLNTELNYLANTGGEGVRQGYTLIDPNNPDRVIARIGRESKNPPWYQDFYADKGRAPSSNELVDLAYKRLREGSPEAPAHQEFLKNEQLLNFIQDLKEKVNQIPKEEPVNGGVNAPQEAGVKGFFGRFNPLNGLKKSEETIARNQVVNNLRKNLGLNIDTGRFQGKAQGVYKVSPEVIRTARSEDIATISHEIGHHLEKRLKLVDPTYQLELEKIAAPLVQGNKAYTPADHAEEGLAEFFRRYLTEEHAQLKQDAPKLYDYIQNSLAGQKLEVKGKKFDVTKGLNQPREDIQKWINQGEYNQAVGKLDFNGKEEKQPGTWKRFYSQFVDDLNPLKLFEKDLNGKVGLGKDSIYKLARNSRGIAEQAQVSLERGIYLNGQKIGDGLSEIVKPLEKLGVDQKDFATYLAVKQSHDLQMSHGKNVAFTDGEMKAVMDRFDGTPVEQVQKGVVQWNKNMMKVLEDAQILKPGTADHLAQTYPNYTPLMRYFDDDAIAGFKEGGFGAAKGFANLSNPVKRMTEEGSQRTIINPLESMVKNSFLVFNAAAKNKVGLRLAEMSNIDGAGAWVEHLGEGGRDGKEHIITVFQDGKGNQYKVRDPELYTAMLSLDHESTNSLIRFLGSMASVLRSGATLTPEFMARNAFRDLTEAFINTGMNPLSFAKGLFHVLRKDEMFDKFLTSGGGQSVLMSLDRNYNREALKEIFRESMKDKAMNVVTSPKELTKLLTGYTPAKLIVKGLRKGAEISELSTRVGQFGRILNKTGDLDEAAYQARDLMDFNRAGSNIRQANRAIAFMNANIQGVDKMARSFWGNGVFDVKSKASYLTRAGVSLVLPAYGLYQLKQHLIENDPEWKRLYENILQWQKDSFFIIPMPGHWFARVPKPFEAGMLYATGTERLLDWAHGQDPKVKEYAKALGGALTPNILPTMLVPLLEGITNYNLFQGRSIVPTSEQKLEKQDQYGINTTETAKLLGKGAANVPIIKDTNFSSPRIIDNTIRGYTAGLGGYAVSGIDAVLNKLGIGKPVPQPAKDLKDAPLLRAFTVSTTGGGQIRQDFYDKWDELSQAHNSDKKNNERATGQEAQDYARMNDVKRGIDKLVKVYKQAQADPKLDPQQKRQVLDGLDQRMDQLAKIGLNRK
jgi:hypothetical protein